jgi:Zn-dependent M28 family amino/carboxypeptidase
MTRTTTEVFFMTQRKGLIRLGLALALALPAGLAAQVIAPIDRIDPDAIEGPIRFLADDLLEGRGPASRGDQLTQLYLSTTLEMLGYEPGGENGSYLQTFDIVGIDAKAPGTWQFRKGGQTLALKWSDQYIAASGVQKDRSEIKDAELVFVGYGIQAPEYQWDDYKGMDLKGKVLVMLNNDPDWDPKLFEGNRRLYYGRWRYKYDSAARQGAAGAIIIHTTPSAGYGWQVIQTSWTGEQFELPAEKEPRIQVAGWATEDAARQLVKLGGQDLDALVKQARSRDFKPVPLSVTTSLVLENRISRKTTGNVGGVLRGSDPKLKDEVVVYTAHHDHLGIGTPDKEGDTIYNGAMDNAAGTAQILAVAKAFAAMPERPKRSILVLFVAAEEQGLLGSLYYSRHPTFAPGKIAANINLDGGNIFGRSEEVVYIGLGKSSLDEVVRTVAAKQGRTVVGDQFPDKGSFYRSDQFNFARIGVPAIYLDTGTKFRGRPEAWGTEKIEAWEVAHYHQASDELTPDWNFDGMVEDARLAFEAGLQIANTDQLPAWNPGDEFEAARKSALATAGK